MSTKKNTKKSTSKKPTAKILPVPKTTKTAPKKKPNAANKAWVTRRANAKKKTSTVKKAK